MIQTQVFSCGGDNIVSCDYKEGKCKFVHRFMLDATVVNFLYGFVKTFVRAYVKM